jgi:hypothetical protein
VSDRSHVSRGLAAGFIAAAAFAAWFFLIDVASGNALRTPTYMSGLVFSSANAMPSAARVALFTILHFAAFGIMGVLVSILLEKAEIRPSIGLGIVLGFLLFDLVFYGSVIITGVDIVEELGWPQVLTANVVAGAVMLGYLRAKTGARVFDWQGMFDRSDILRQGLVAGLIGGVMVAIWFLFIDMFRGQALFTPAALGSALFYGVNNSSDVVISAPVVIGYSLVHFAAFILLGLFAAWLMAWAETHAPALIGVVLFFVTLEVLSLGLLSALASWLFDTVPWWAPIVANLLAAAGMAAYLWAKHPALHARFGQPLEESEA